MKTLYLRNENEIRTIHVKNLSAVTVDDYLCTFITENEPDFFLHKIFERSDSLVADIFYPDKSKLYCQ